MIELNWPDFEDRFPDVNWVIMRFTKLEVSRNIVAHNNVLRRTRLIASKCIWLIGRDRSVDRVCCWPIASYSAMGRRFKFSHRGCRGDRRLRRVLAAESFKAVKDA